MNFSIRNGSSFQSAAHTVEHNLFYSTLWTTRCIEINAELNQQTITFNLSLAFKDCCCTCGKRHNSKMILIRNFVTVLFLAKPNVSNHFNVHLHWIQCTESTYVLCCSLVWRTKTQIDFLTLNIFILVWLLSQNKRQQTKKKKRTRIRQ